MKVRRIVWPGHVQDPVMWASADGGSHWDTGFIGSDVAIGQCAGPYPTWQWREALVRAMDWAYHPQGEPPKGWRFDD